MRSIVVVSLCLLASVAHGALNVKPVPQGFPEYWDGDSYTKAPMEVIKKAPDWVNGYFFAQSAGTYGDQSRPVGEKVTHLFDAVSGVSIYDIAPGGATFTAKYYPNQIYHIWQFNDRNLTKSKIAWSTTFADINATARNMWKTIPTDAPEDQPVVDFWKVGGKVVAASEGFYSLGLTVYPEEDKFKNVLFQDVDDLLLKRQLFGIQEPVHEHVDQDTGLIWNTGSAMNTSANPPTWHQVVYTIDAKGMRRVQGVFNFSPIDYSKCDKSTGSYKGSTGGKGNYYPRYMHTVTATKNYLIMPMTSIVVKTCQIVMGLDQNPTNATVYKSKNFAFEYDQAAPLVFLLFDKRSKTFVGPIDFDKDTFITHQFNSYETADGKINSDLLNINSFIYDAVTMDTLLKNGDHPEWANNATRFVLDPKAKTVTAKSLLPADDPTRLEFPQVNKKFEGKQYKYGYVVQFPFLQPNQILKIDMDTPDGSKNKYFKPSETISMSEPYFVARPGATDEEDGVVVVRGLDTSITKTRVYVLDPKTMQPVGEYLSPYYTPFGLHNRFYLKEQLGETKQQATTGSSDGGFFSWFSKWF